MALCLAGGLLATSKSFSEQSLCEKLQQWAEGNLLMELIDQSYKDLEDETAKILRKLYIFLDTFDAKAQDFICQDQYNEQLTKLVERQLVMFNEKSGCYSLHPTIQKFLRDKITEPERLDAEKRHATHFMIRLQGLQSELTEKKPSSIRSSVNAFDSGLSATKYLKDNKAELRQLINLSEATFESRNYSKAKGLHEDSLEMALEIGEDSSATMLLDKLAFFKRL